MNTKIILLLALLPALDARTAEPQYDFHWGRRGIVRPARPVNLEGNANSDATAIWQVSDRSYVEHPSASARPVQPWQLEVRPDPRAIDQFTPSARSARAWQPSMSPDASSSPPDENGTVNAEDQAIEQPHECSACGGRCSRARSLMARLFSSHYAHGAYGHSPLHDWLHSTCEMPPHNAYILLEPDTYYFRPYNQVHLGQQAIMVTNWGGDPRHPYANKIFERVYAQWEAERALPPIILPQEPAGEVVPLPENGAPEQEGPEQDESEQEGAETDGASTAEPPAVSPESNSTGTPNPLRNQNQIEGIEGTP